MHLTIKKMTRPAKFQTWSDVLGYAVGDGKGRWYLVVEVVNRIPSYDFVILIKLTSVSGNANCPRTQNSNRPGISPLDDWVAEVADANIELRVM